MTGSKKISSDDQEDICSNLCKEDIEKEFEAFKKNSINSEQRSNYANQPKKQLGNNVRNLASDSGRHHIPSGSTEKSKFNKFSGKPPNSDKNNGNRIENPNSLSRNPPTRPRSDTNVTQPLEAPSVQIGSTNLYQNSNQYSKSILSQEGEENAFTTWKNSCRKGVYNLDSLLDTCEKNPDSVLISLKNSIGIDKGAPIEYMENNNALRKKGFLMQKLYGEGYGDPKHHLLMVDASTSIHKLDFQRKPEEKLPEKISEEPPKKISPPKELSKPVEIVPSQPIETAVLPNTTTTQSSKISEEESEEDEAIEEEVIKDEEYLVSAAPEGSTRNSQGSKADTQESNEGSKKSQESVGSDESSEVLEQEPQPELKGGSVTSSKESKEAPEEPEQKPLIPITKDRRTSILFKENKPEDEENRQYSKRPSAVSWRAMTSASETDSTASLEQVVKDATAKAEIFRQNLDTKKQHSLLDIVKRKSTIDKKIEEPKSANNPPPKRKKFFNFKCLEKKKQQQQSEEKDKGKEREETTQSDSDEDEETEELEESKKQAQSSQMYIDNYRRRNTSFIENPVFEKKKELNQFLNNI